MVFDEEIYSLRRDIDRLEKNSGSDSYTKLEVDNKLATKLDVTATAADSDQLNGLNGNDYVIRTDIMYLERDIDVLYYYKLDKTAKAADSDKLDGEDSTFFGKQSDINTIFNQLNTKAVIAQGINWIIFDTGIKICWGKGSVSLGATNGTQTININLPISFTSNPTGFVTGNSQTTFVTFSVTSTTTTNLTVWARNTYTTSTTVSYSWMIIGK